MYRMDYLSLGPTPSDEACEQLGPNYNAGKARRECYAFLNQLRRQFGDEPDGARLRVKSFPHDFGSYLEVCVFYSEENADAVEYAYKLEGEMPENWDSEALAELEECKHA